jgi:hypothetical protein
VPRISVQATPFLEVGTNWWFTPDPNKVVIATKWRIWIYQGQKIKISMSPGSWQSIFFTKGSSLRTTKHLFYDFLGLSIQHSEIIYTRLMFDGYGRYSGISKPNYGAIAGLEQRLSKSLVFVVDYFGGSGEGYGLAPGFVWYVLENGNNLPIYFAYQFDNDTRKNDVILLEIGYTFQLFRKSKKN